MPLNTRLNMFPKSIKISMLSTSPKKEFRNELNIRLLKDRLFTNPNKKLLSNNQWSNNQLSNNKSFNNQCRSFNNQCRLFNNLFFNNQLFNNL